jgi:hypothetical protein
MKHYYCIQIFFLLFSFGKMSGQTGQEKKIKQDSTAKVYPTPPANKNMLFYIQRTHNTNTIVYELNYNTDSTINEKEPVKVFWIRYADNGEILPLSSIQKTFAYGLSAKLIDKEKKTFKLTLTAYDKREIYLIKTRSNTDYHAYININGSLSILAKIFFKTDGGTFWSPNISYVELVGRSISNGKTVVERFKP